MTSEKVMPSSSAAGIAHREASPRALAAILLIAAASTGCGHKPIRQPSALNSPYPAPKVWAVVPFTNESGVSIVDGAAMADRLTEQIQQVPGFRVLPVNRVYDAMAAHRMPAVASVNEAEQLMRTLGADGLIVGSITAWDPYDPPKIGVTIDLYRRQIGDVSPIDVRELTRAATSDELPGLVTHDRPIAQAGGYFDAANGKIRQNLTAYAYGRAPEDSPAGWRRYLLSIDLYAEFVAHELARELFSAEWQRMTIDRRELAAQEAARTADQDATPDPDLPAIGSRDNR